MKRAILPLRSVLASSRSANFRLALLGLDRAVAQHQMREIEIEFMRRHIGTFRHEAHVAERAGIDDRLEVFAVDGIQFAIGGGVDEIEKARKGIAEIEAAAAAVTNIEDPPQSRRRALLRHKNPDFASPTDAGSGRQGHLHSWDTTLRGLKQEKDGLAANQAIS